MALIESRRANRPVGTKGTGMPSLYDEITIRADADSIWAVVGDPTAVTRWFSGIVECSIEGDIRTCVLSNGATIQEKVLESDSSKRAFTYQILSGMPVESHRATVTVVEISGAESQVRYSTEVNPPSLERVLSRSVRSGLETLKDIFEPTHAA